MIDGVKDNREAEKAKINTFCDPAFVQECCFGEVMLAGRLVRIW